MASVNFGETLTYWYLRLNGFFPLANFVLHKHELTVGHSADCDILAIRLPGVYEEVGGHLIDWDRAAFERWELDLTRTIGLIVEVKTGKRYAKGVRRAFDQTRLEYATRRLGLWHNEALERTAAAVSAAAVYNDPYHPYTIGKLLVAERFPRNANIPACLKLNLREAQTFIRDRIQRYEEKARDKVYFPSDLIQYIIWHEATCAAR